MSPAKVAAVLALSTISCSGPAGQSGPPEATATEGGQPTDSSASGEGASPADASRSTEASGDASAHGPIDASGEAASEPSDGAPEGDFQARCTAPGVIKCIGWDNPSDFTPASGGGGYADGLYPGDDGSFGTMDTSIKTSGAGSLEFTVKPFATATDTGYWRANFGSVDNITAFGPHTTLYFQFRLRIDAPMLDFDWTTVSNNGWKVFIAYGPIPGPSCTGAQFVQENTDQTNIATAYTSCGTPGLYTNDGDPPYLKEQGDYNCPYDSNGGYTSNPNCFAYLADTWMTEYWIVQIGDFGQPNTSFTAYIAPDGQPLKKWIDLPNFAFNAGAASDDALESMLLEPYMSGANGTVTNPTAHLWFDELIISTQPIAAPN